MSRRRRKDWRYKQVRWGKLGARIKTPIFENFAMERHESRLQLKTVEDCDVVQKNVGVHTKGSSSQFQYHLPFPEWLRDLPQPPKTIMLTTHSR